MGRSEGSYRSTAKAQSLQRSSAVAGRGTRRLLDSVFHIDRLLRSGACVSLAKLADEVEASPRTVQRYLDVLRDRLGADVVYDREERGYRYGEQSLRVPATALSEGDLVALYLAEPVLAQYRGTDLEARFRAAFEKLTTALPNRVLGRLSSVPTRVGVKAAAPTHEDVRRFDAICAAVLADRRIELTYYSAHRSATSTRLVDPYALHAVNGVWYLVGYCHSRAAVVPFRVDRIWSWKSKAERFARPPEFRAEEFFGPALGAFLPADRRAPEPDEGIVIRFSTSVARYVREMVWHPSQALESVSDGRLVMRLHIGVSPEVERFVLSWGEDAVVLAPEALRRRIARRLAAARAAYGSAVLGDDTF